MPANIPAWMNQIKKHLVADKKKTGVLGFLLLVLLGFLGRFLGSGAAPAAVDAASVAEVAPVQSAPPANPVGLLVRPSVDMNSAMAAAMQMAEYARRQMMGASAQPSAAPTPGSPSPVVKIGDLPRVLERDLFATNGWSESDQPGENASSSEGGAAAAGEPSGSAQIWHHLGTALGTVQEKRRGELEKLDADLGNLKLQSTVTGALPMAYISGRLVHPGDTIDGFSVVRIKERRVVIRKYGLTRELKMP